MIISKRLPIIYNTDIDFINDINVKPGMIIITLGTKTINDGGGSIYRIIDKDDPIDKEAKFYLKKQNAKAEEIILSGLNKSNELEEIHNELDELKKSLDSIKTYLAKNS